MSVLPIAVIAAARPPANGRVSTHDSPILPKVFHETALAPPEALVAGAGCPVPAAFAAAWGQGGRNRLVASVHAFVEAWLRHTAPPPRGPVEGAAEEGARGGRAWRSLDRMRGKGGGDPAAAADGAQRTAVAALLLVNRRPEAAHVRLPWDAVWPLSAHHLWVRPAWDAGPPRNRSGAKSGPRHARHTHTPRAPVAPVAGARSRPLPACGAVVERALAS